MREPVHTATCCERAAGAPTRGRALHASAAGSYDAPSPRGSPFNPPHTMNAAPVHTPLCHERADGAPMALIARHVSVTGS